MWHEHQQANMQCTSARTNKQVLWRKRLETSIENQRLVESRHYYILKWRAGNGVFISIEQLKSEWNEVSHGGALLGQWCEKVYRQ